jgi:endonuclease YncB( thermonuclease family)
MSGLLRIRGTIDIAQFWPVGSSDADTSKVHVTVDKGSFAFAPDGKNFTTTHAYEGAFVLGASRKAVIDSKSRVTVRLQGIDAPELHFRAAALKSKRPEVTEEKRVAYNKFNKVERRQYLAESATVALAKKLKAYGGQSVPCEVVSFVDHPFELVDTYGRVVGNIRVGKKFQTDINVWLAAEGWVYPTFYSSMTEEEIQTLLKAASKGKKKGRAWAYLSDDTSKFDPNLVYRKGGPIDAANDVGNVLLPKLFRRQVAYHMEKKAKVFNGKFGEFLRARADECYLTDQFLSEGLHSAATHKFAEFLKGKRFLLGPEELVFREKFSSVVDAHGERVERF